jgi:hypothetical protein
MHPEVERHEGEEGEYCAGDRRCHHDGERDLRGTSCDVLPGVGGVGTADCDM